MPQEVEGIFNLNFGEIISKISKLIDDVNDKGVEITIWGVKVLITLPK
jgi:hypothetical protein